MPVSMHVVDAGHRRPVFRLFDPRERIRGFFAGVGAGPVVRADGVGGVRGFFEGVVGRIGATFLDGADLGADAVQRIAQAVRNLRNGLTRLTA